MKSLIAGNVKFNGKLSDLVVRRKFLIINKNLNNNAIYK